MDLPGTDQPVSDVERDLSQKLVSVALLTAQVAEAAVWIRQQAVEQQAAADARAAAAARAQRRADRAADRLRWSRTSDPGWLGRAKLDDLMQAWAAAARWDTDPAADAAARRVETRLADAAPNAMRDYQRRRDNGASRAEAMHAVGRDWDTEVTARAAGHPPGRTNPPTAGQQHTASPTPPPPGTTAPGAAARDGQNPRPSGQPTTSTTAAAGSPAAASGIVIDRNGEAVPVFPRRRSGPRPQRTPQAPPGPPAQQPADPQGENPRRHRRPGPRCEPLTPLPRRPSLPRPEGGTPAVAHTPSDPPAADAPRLPAPPVALDVPAILAALQDQLDDLAAAVDAQQRLLDAQQRRLDELAAGRTGRR